MLSWPAHASWAGGHHQLEHSVCAAQLSHRQPALGVSYAEVFNRSCSLVLRKVMNFRVLATYSKIYFFFF